MGKKVSSNTEIENDLKDNLKQEAPLKQNSSSKKPENCRNSV